ncbi:nrps [Saitozyma podzolica]|uniref:Nrps n=1 Tax=Saitozyma podzolica TaxID=1890683 RepID=A0A427Y3Y6_9TREE|nr:nrps [Saitozyma podzolica]
MSSSVASWRRVGGSYERPLGPSEVAYFAGSADGAGDMALHLTLSSLPELFLPDRVATAWACLRARHPLLASRLAVRDGAELDVYFKYPHPASAVDALDDARDALSYNSLTKDELFENHLSGPRSLSETRLSHLTISTTTSSTTASSPPNRTFSLFLTIPHFAGDGMTLNALTHELVLLLSKPKSLQADELDKALTVAPTRLPLSLEDQLPRPVTSFQRAAQAVDYQLRLSREVGGHVLPRQERGPKKTVMKEIELDEHTTKRILQRCKKEGVTINSALFALVAMAWAAITPGGLEPDLPILMYSALNVRPQLPPSKASDAFLAISYFTVSLPAFLPLPSSRKGRFWQRARSVRAQILRASTSQLLVSRCLAMSDERQARAMKRPAPFREIVKNSAPSKALCGVTPLGNLDRTYTHGQYAPGLELLTLSITSRQRQGGFLLGSHTFKGRLWFQMTWDEYGFEEGALERFWAELWKLLVGYCTDAEA